MKTHLTSLTLLSTLFWFVPACQSEMDASSSTNWFTCEEPSDCDDVPGAVDCSGGYCVDGDGERIQKPSEGTGGDGGGSSTGGTSTDGGSSSGGRASGGRESGGSSSGGSAAVGGSASGGTSMSGGLGAGGALGGAAGSSSSEATCEDFDVLRSCSVDEDCVALPAEADCCGNGKYVGIGTDDASEFEELELDCRAPGLCECPSLPYAGVEDGRLFVPDSGSTVGAVCQAGSCRSRVETRPCGEDGLVCQAGEVCVFSNTVSGPTETVFYACEPNPCGTDPLDCSCAESLCVSRDNRARLCSTTSYALGDVACQDQAQ